MCSKSNRISEAGLRRIIIILIPVIKLDSHHFLTIYNNKSSFCIYLIRVCKFHFNVFLTYELVSTLVLDLGVIMPLLLRMLMTVQAIIVVINISSFSSSFFFEQK